MASAMTSLSCATLGAKAFLPFDPHFGDPDGVVLPRLFFEWITGEHRKIGLITRRNFSTFVAVPSNTCWNFCVASYCLRKTDPLFLIWRFGRSPLNADKRAGGRDIRSKGDRDSFINHRPKRVNRALFFAEPHFIIFDIP